MTLPTRKAYLTFLASQLGVREIPDGSNRTKYGVAYGWNGVAWCQEFDWYCADVMTVPHIKTASTVAAVAEARKKGTWKAGTAGIQPGDSVYFHWASSTRAHDQPDHVETCEKVLADGIQTIGGNVENCVHRQIRRANILGHIRHEFAPEPAYNRVVTFAKAYLRLNPNVHSKVLATVHKDDKLRAIPGGTVLWARTTRGYILRTRIRTIR